MMFFDTSCPPNRHHMLCHVGRWQSWTPPPLSVRDDDPSGYDRVKIIEDKITSVLKSWKQETELSCHPQYNTGFEPRWTCVGFLN